MNEYSYFDILPQRGLNFVILKKFDAFFNSLTSKQTSRTEN